MATRPSPARQKSEPASCPGQGGQGCGDTPLQASTARTPSTGSRLQVGEAKGLALLFGLFPPQLPHWKLVSIPWAPRSSPARWGGSKPLTLQLLPGCCCHDENAQQVPARGSGASPSSSTPQALGPVTAGTNLATATIHQVSSLEGSCPPDQSHTALGSTSVLGWDRCSLDPSLASLALSRRSRAQPTFPQACQGLTSKDHSTSSYEAARCPSAHPTHAVSLSTVCPRERDGQSQGCPAATTVHAAGSAA